MSGVEQSHVSLTGEGGHNIHILPSTPGGARNGGRQEQEAPGQPLRGNPGESDFSSNIKAAQAEMGLTSSSFILISFSVSVSGVGRGRIGIGLSILLS